ncbi:MAG: hypothetical protein M3O02_04340 [Acidobacteriota bacterium]|nr:hypothetical protein [Acidobacteriota bacterium]
MAKTGTAGRQKSSSVFALIAASAVVMTGVATIAVAETKIDRSKLPPAVEKTVEEQSQGATIKGFMTETEGGVFEYEAEMVVNGHTKDIAIAKDGTLLEIEEEVAMNTLPDAVQKALTAKAAGAKITKVETLTKKGKLVAYEAATVKGTKKSEFQLGPNGEKLAHEE